MNTFKYVIVACFFLLGFIVAIQAADEAQATPAEAEKAPADSIRQKRYPFAYPYSYGLGYSAYHAPIAAYHAPVAAYHAPLAYSAYHAPIAYHGYHAPLAYSAYHF